MPAQADGNAGQKASENSTTITTGVSTATPKPCSTQPNSLAGHRRQHAEAKGYLNAGTQPRQACALSSNPHSTTSSRTSPRVRGRRQTLLGPLIRTDKAATVLVPDQYGYRTNTWSPNKKHCLSPSRKSTALRHPYPKPLLNQGYETIYKTIASHWLSPRRTGRLVLRGRYIQSRHKRRAHGCRLCR